MWSLCDKLSAEPTHARKQEKQEKQNREKAAPHSTKTYYNDKQRRQEEEHQNIAKLFTELYYKLIADSKSAVALC